MHTAMSVQVQHNVQLLYVCIYTELYIDVVGNMYYCTINMHGRSCLMRSMSLRSSAFLHSYQVVHFFEQHIVK